MLFSKLVAKLLNLFGKGATSLPGKIALSLKYDILNTLSKGVKIICVTGTNGKTTTCALIEQGIKSNNHSYFINKSGANMISGVATAFIMNSNLFGKCKKEFAVLECDENSFPIISRYLDAELIVVTNLFRDQLDRYGEIDYTQNKIVEAIKNIPRACVLVNADCPMTKYITNLVDNKSITFGINVKTDVNAIADINYCPKCNSSLSYQSRIFAHLGDYYCSSCGYQRGKLDYAVDDIVCINDYGSNFILNGNLININLGGIYNIYNYTCAYSVLDYFNLQKDNCMDNFSGAFGRMEWFDNKNILLMLVKNPVGFANCISYAQALKGCYDFVFALNDNSADSIDVSWIWDVDFTKLKGKINSVSTIGTRANDIALRIKYDNISVNRIYENEDYSALINNFNNKTIIFANYTSMMNMRHFLIKKYGGDEFWQ